MKNKLINYFRKPWNFCCLIGETLGIMILFIISYQGGIFKAPTINDFIPMHEKEEQIIENFDNIYSMENVNIFIKDEEIVVQIISQEKNYYLVEMIFSKDKRFITSQEISNKVGFNTTNSKFTNMLELFTFPFFTGIYLGLLICLIIYGIYNAIIYIKSKIPSNFNY